MKLCITSSTAATFGSCLVLFWPVLRVHLHYVDIFSCVKSADHQFGISLFDFAEMEGGQDCREIVAQVESNDCKIPSSSMVEADPHTVQVVCTWFVPQTLKDVTVYLYICTIWMIFIVHNPVTKDCCLVMGHRRPSSHHQGWSSTCQFDTEVDICSLPKHQHRSRDESTAALYK